MTTTVKEEEPQPAPRQVATVAPVLNRRKKIPLFIKLLILLGTILLGFLVWTLLKPKQEAQVVAVKRGEAVFAVYGTALVEPEVQTIVRSQAGGTITKLHAKENTEVKEGDVLAEIEDSLAAERLKTAETAYQNALRTREIGPPSQPALDAQTKKVEQLRKLLEMNNISQSQFDQEATTLQTFRDKVATEKLNLDNLVEQAHQALQAAINNQEKGLVTSPQSGIVLESYVQVGQIITNREQMFLVGSKECVIRAKINEEDVGALKPNMDAIVRLFTHPGAKFQGLIKEILPHGRGMEYSVLITLPQPPSPFYPGMTGELNIVVGKRENALIVPARAIRMRNSLAYVVQDGIVRTREVKVGYRSIDMAEILEGLNEGELVILNDHDLFRPGDRVRTRRMEGDLSSTK